MVFQDPYSTLNPVRTVGSTLAEALTATDDQVRDVRKAVGELLERVGLPAQYAERKPVALSGGERQRVAVARALAVRPRLIVCDEPVSALDVSVQAQILNLLTEVRRELGVSYLFITHDLAVVRQVAERVYVLRQGEVVEQGSTSEVLDNPQHWYTRKLVDSIPSSDEAWLAQAAETAVDLAEVNGEPAQPQGACAWQRKRLKALSAVPGPRACRRTPPAACCCWSTPRTTAPRRLRRRSPASTPIRWTAKTIRRRRT